MDGGYSARHAFGAGADIVTVLGAAADETVRKPCAAESAGGKIMVDLINVPDPAQGSARLAGLGAHCFLLHLPSDLAVREGGLTARSTGLNLFSTVCGGRWSQCRQSRQNTTLKPQIVIVGSAIYKAHDPRAEALCKSSGG